MTQYRAELHRLYRRWKAGAISKDEFHKRRAALKTRHVVRIERERQRKRNKPK